MAHRDIVVMGASAGGVEALSEIVRALPDDLPAAIFIVMHMSADSPGTLAGVLGRHAWLPVTEAIDGEPIRQGRIYVPRPDRHLILAPDRVRVVRGPKQNRHRSTASWEARIPWAGCWKRCSPRRPSCVSWWTGPGEPSRRTSAGSADG
jgi:chemotaxis response regulator CheB